MSFKLPLLLACLFSVAAAGESSRVWTQAASGKTLEGTLVGKNADGSVIQVKTADGKQLEIKTATLAKADQDHVSKWTPPKAGPRGIVRGRATALVQGQGGKSRVMRDLQSVLTNYGKPVEDTAPAPDAVVYKGPALKGGAGPVTVTYLMPRDKALGLLVDRPGPASKRPAVAPGFPPGMVVHEYDIRFGVYNRLFVIVDQADQVVALQIKAENKNNPATPQLGSKQEPMPMNSTSDFIEPRTGGATAWVLDLRKEEKRIVIDLEWRGETLLFLPQPMINLCLFHIDRDLRR